MPLGIAGRGRPVGRIVGGVPDLGEMPVAVVYITHDKTAGKGHGLATTEAIVGIGQPERFGIDVAGLGNEATETVVGKHLAVSATGIAHAGKLADAPGCSVVDPGTVALWRAARNHATQPVVVHGDHLVLRIFLPDQFAESIVPVLPAAQVRVIHGGLATAQIVGHASHDSTLGRI